jgi:hypothetical protein
VEILKNMGKIEENAGKIDPALENWNETFVWEVGNLEMLGNL